MEQYSYLLFGLILLVPWIAAHVARPDLRRELWISSIATSPLGPIFQYWYLRDYWTPQVLGPWSVGFEDVLFGFCMGGLGAVSYELGTLLQQAATTALNNVGLVLAVGEPFIVSDPTQVGTVRAQSTPPGTWVDRGTTVTVRLGQLPLP